MRGHFLFLPLFLVTEMMMICHRVSAGIHGAIYSIICVLNFETIQLKKQNFIICHTETIKTKDFDILHLSLFASFQIFNNPLFELDFGSTKCSSKAGFFNPFYRQNTTSIQFKFKHHFIEIPLQEFCSNSTLLSRSIWQKSPIESLKVQLRWPI